MVLEVKTLKAIALLESLVEEMPKEDDIEETYVNLYHQALSDIQSETGHDLTYFAIPASELERQVTNMLPVLVPSQRDESREPIYSNERYCKRERFLIGLKGALNFLNSITQGSTKPPIGFT